LTEAGECELVTKSSGRVSKANKKWNKKCLSQSLLKDKMPESTITQWESVRGCVNITTVGASVKSVGASLETD